jgi:hypothetical protein
MNQFNVINYHKLYFYSGFESEEQDFEKLQNRTNIAAKSRILEFIKHLSFLLGSQSQSLVRANGQGGSYCGRTFFVSYEKV